MGWAVFGTCYAVIWELLVSGVFDVSFGPTPELCISNLRAILQAMVAVMNAAFPVSHLFQYVSDLPLFQALGNTGVLFWYVSPAVLVGLGLFIAGLAGFFRLRAQKSPQMPNNV